MSERVFPPDLSIASHSAKLRTRILFLLLKGKSQREIARRLKISVGTVGYHVARLRIGGEYKN
jgi:DNA-binding CsgD family transcriptional regulator